MNAHTTLPRADLQITAQRLSEVKAQISRAPDSEYNRLIREEFELEQEFCAAFHELTGMRWSDAERLMS